MIRFFNTYGRKLEEFTPIREGEVGLYSCGPTVYDYAHIGNFRANIFTDVLKRFLKFSGFKVRHVMNITDVEDKIIAAASKAGVTIKGYTEKYIEAFFDNLNVLRIQKADVYPRATEHIKEMSDLIERLEQNGFTYRRDGSVYFDIDKFKDYGALAGIERSQLKTGARVDRDEYDKENAQDFVLWKAKKTDDEPAWDTPFGAGRPGWHLECSAMSMKYLGEHFDIHSGGIDLIFPHHQNEIAQSEGATGVRFVNYWLHCAYLQVDGQKMSKSLGNTYTINYLVEKGFDPVSIRYFLLSSHYRSPLNFTFEGAAQSDTAVARLRDFKRRLEREKPQDGDEEKTTETIEQAARSFKDFIEDDLNISGALGEVFTFVRNINTMLDHGALTETGRLQSLALLLKWDSILDVLNEDIASAFDSVWIDDMINRREEARKARDWASADRIRKELLESGIILEDTQQGTIWKRK
jgi:cysteinyl-tRNA synthetase